MPVSPLQYKGINRSTTLVGLVACKGNPACKGAKKKLVPEPTQKAHPGEDVPEQDGEGGHGKGEYLLINYINFLSPR